MPSLSPPGAGPQARLGLLRMAMAPPYACLELLPHMAEKVMEGGNEGKVRYVPSSNGPLLLCGGANVMTACLNRYTRNLEPSMGLNRWVIVEGRDSRRGQAYLGGYKEDTEQRRQCGGMPAGGLGHADGNEQTETESLFL